MSFDPDSFLETWVQRSVPLWGPFYAVYYIIRLLWHELFGDKEI